MLAEQKIKKINLRILDIIIVTALNLAFTIVIGIVGWLVLFWDLFTHPSRIPQTPQEIMQLVSALPPPSQFLLDLIGVTVFLATSTVIPILWIKFARQCRLTDIGLNRKKWGSNLLKGFAIGALFTFSWGIIAALLSVTIVPGGATKVPFVSTFSWWANLMITVLIAPVGESIFVVGLVFLAFAKKVGFKLAMLITSAIYAFMHMDALVASGAPSLTFIGFFLSMSVQVWLYRRKESLLLPIGFHTAHNLIIFLSNLSHHLR